MLDSPSSPFHIWHHLLGFKTIDHLTFWQAQGQVLVQSPGPKKAKRNLASGLVTKILWATTPPDHPTHNFKRGESAYIVQIDDLSTPECQEGVPSHSRWTARGRTWGSPPSSRGTLSKNVLRVWVARERTWMSPRVQWVKEMFQKSLCDREWSSW